MAASPLLISPPEPAVTPTAQGRAVFAEQARAALRRPPQENGCYWKAVVAEGSESFAPNLRSRPGWVSTGRCGWPVTVHDGPEGNSFPASMLTQYVAYPRAEIDQIPPGVQRLAARIGLQGFDGLLRIAQADRVVQWNSWLLSTNLHPAGLSQSIPEVTGILRDQFPDHAILLKNVDPMRDPELIPNLEQAGYELMTSRQVFFFDGRTADFWGKSTVKRDVKEFAADARFHWVGHSGFTTADAPRIAELYRRLYLEKHSLLNPQYTVRFVERALTERWLEFHGLRDADGTLLGVFGFFTQDGVTSVPFIGYDTELPQDAGLYRRLFTGILKNVAERRQLMNYSSGAGDFKKRRGGIPVIEFNAVYSRHLPPMRQGAFRLAGQVLNRYARPWLEKNSH